MRLYQLAHGGKVCSCKGGVVRPHKKQAPESRGGAALLLGSAGAGMLGKMESKVPTNEPIPNTETLQRKLANLSGMKIRNGKTGKYISL